MFIGIHAMAETKGGKGAEGSAATSEAFPASLSFLSREIFSRNPQTCFDLANDCARG